MISILKNLNWSFLIGCIIGSSIFSIIFNKWFWNEKHQLKLKIKNAQGILKKFYRDNEDPIYIIKVENHIKDLTKQYDKLCKKSIKSNRSKK